MDVMKSLPLIGYVFISFIEMILPATLSGTPGLKKTKGIGAKSVAIVSK
jgi:hypothetical protein